MIEVVKKQGGVHAYKPIASEAYGNISSLATDIFFKAIKTCQPFVFNPEKDSTPRELDCSGYAMVQGNVDGIDQEDINLDSPFGVYSLEILGKSLTQPKLFDKHKAYVKCIMVFDEIGKVDENFKDVLLLYLLVEVNGKDYASVELATSIEAKDGGATLIKVFPGTDEEETFFPTSATIPLVKELLKRFNSERVGTQFTNKKLQVKTPTGEKFKRTINKLIHITPKSNFRKYQSDNKLDIDWSHRWFSRGHWRRLKPTSLGKNRDGEYVEMGRTWVSESIKGPEGKPLVADKIRLVGR